MRQYFGILALFLGIFLSKSFGGVFCENTYCTEYKVGVGIQGGMHNAKSLDASNAPASLHIDTNIWRKWFYFGFKGQFGLGGAWITRQDSKTQATYDDIGVRFALGLPINAVFSSTPSIVLSEPIFLYLTLGIGINDYAHKVSLPSQKRNAVGLGIAGIHTFRESWNFEYALEYGYIYNAHYKYSPQVLGLRENIKIGNNNHDLRVSLGLTQSKGYGFYTRLSGIYRILDSTIEGTFVYSQSTQAIGMFEMGMSLGSLGL